jgi:hypothetical protein
VAAIGVTVAATTGLRQGELLGLRCQDVDLKAGTLHVRNALARSWDGGWELAESKTARRRRMLNLPPLHGARSSADGADSGRRLERPTSSAFARWRGACGRPARGGCRGESGERKRDGRPGVRSTLHQALGDPVKVFVGLLAAFLFVGCSGSVSPSSTPRAQASPVTTVAPSSVGVTRTPSATAAPQTRAPSPPSASPAPSAELGTLVGTWTRVNDCESFVGALEDADLADLAPEWLVGAGYFATEAEIDPADPCAGATEVEHSHFFTADGEFGSLDEHGRQVDDGQYDVVDEDTIALAGGQALVDFALSSDGNAVSFTVPVPEPCEADCRGNYAYLISAFYPGEFARSE